MHNELRTTTDDPGGNTSYEYQVGYDGHRRINTMANSLETPFRGAETIAAYTFTHDANGNPLTQATTGMADFAGDDRAFTVDRLDRLTGTGYQETGTTEESIFDLVGNREEHTNRANDTTVYGPANEANEYADVGGNPVEYDEAGNLSVDEDSRQYTYDEQNRLIQIRAADDTVLANYTYDALGRRISFEDPVAGVATRYYYAGQSVIEERDASDVLARYHVNGAQYLDERVATFDDSTGEFSYYLVNQNFSIAGTGNADGSQIERLDYSSGGDFAGGGGGPGEAYAHDADGDDDVDLADFADLQACFISPDAACLAVHDFDTAGQSDEVIDLADYEGFYECFGGPGVTPSGGAGHDAEPDDDVDLADFAGFQACFGTTTPDCLAVFDFDAEGQSDGSIGLADLTGFEHRLRGPNVPPAGGCPTIPQARASSRNGDNLPPSGTFALHGRPVDVLSDGHALFYIRARYYDPQHSRWLQRDPVAYTDGNNLYESFRGNATRFTDPKGKYTKLASGWNNGDEVFYQRILFFAGITSEFSVGSYRYLNGEKFVVYDEDVEGKGYTYVLTLKQVEWWSKNIADRSDYESFVRLNAVAIDRYTGKPVKRSLGEELGRSVESMMQQEQERLEGLIGSFEPMTFIAGPAMMALTDEDVGREVSVPGRFRVASGVFTALEVAPAAHLLGVGGRVGTRTLSTRVLSSTASREAAYLEYKALRLQGYRASEAYGFMKQFRAGINPQDRFAFHFTTIKGGRGILAEVYN
ncbi:MAG: hypothetical protein KAV82_13265 [Phycisphaerae bacterium]|nr:hypothetical protein [Phycisphaerae bacterium]